LNRSDRKNKGNGNGIEIPVTDIEETAGETTADEPVEAEPVTISREEYEAIVAEAARSREQYLMAVADFDNFRKRAAREKEDIVCFANENLIYELLPILDNLQRALSMELDQAGMDSVLEGVRMVNDQLYSVLGACGLEPVEAVGIPFDPQYHEAVGVLPSEEHDEGTVISEFQKGYSLKGKILRPSMVHVAGQPSGNNTDEGDN
jgi:molecular chaperone GrpE